MGRARKPLSAQKGNLTVSQQNAIKQTELLTDVGCDELVNPPKWLINKVAKDEYVRLSNLLLKSSIAGDLDINNLAVYCNAYASYRQLLTTSKKIDPQYYDPATGLMIVNPEFEKITMQITKYTEIMLKHAGKLGLTIDSRLKAGAVKSNLIQDKIQEDFGDI